MGEGALETFHQTTWGHPAQPDSAAGGRRIRKVPLLQSSRVAFLRLTAHISGESGLPLSSPVPHT